MQPKKSIFVRNTIPAILRMEPYVAGPTTEEILRLAQISPGDIAKLSSNENPLGPSPRAVEAIREWAPRVSLYPSTRCERLRKAIANALGRGLAIDNILVAAGSSEIFSLIIRAFSSPSDEVVFAYPSFPVYGDAAIVDGRTPVTVALEEPLFDLTLAAIRKHCSSKTRIIFVTQPNNPTSRLLAPNEVQKICEFAKESIVVCDEAYVEFAEGYPTVSAVNLLEEFDNLLVTRTFSKAYGLSDLRVGYVVGPPEAIGILSKIRPRWNNGELAQEAAIAALGDVEHLRTTLTTVRDGRIFLSERLKELGFAVTPEPQGNFVFASPSPLGLRAEHLVFELMRKGISVRGPPKDWKLDYLRISVGTRTENEKLADVLASILSR